MPDSKQVNIKMKRPLYEALDSFCESNDLQKSHFICRVIERALAVAQPLSDSFPEGEELLATAVAKN